MATDALRVKFCYLNCPKTINLQLSHIKLFYSTGTGVTRMQLAKVMIASVLVLTACAEGLPEGEGCVLKCIQNVYCISWLLY